LNSRIAEPFYQRGYVHLDMKNFDTAIVDFERAIKLSPDMAWAYQGLGTAWMFKGHMEKAIENFSRAIEKDPRIAWAFCNRGVAKVYLGQETQAQADFDECVRLRPDLKSEVDRRAELARSLRRIGKQE